MTRFPACFGGDIFGLVVTLVTFMGIIVPTLIILIGDLVLERGRNIKRIMKYSGIVLVVFYFLLFIYMLHVEVFGS